MKCPRCGSDDIRKIGRIITLRGKKQRFICENGHTFYDKSDYVRDYPLRIKKVKK